MGPMPSLGFFVLGAFVGGFGTLIGAGGGFVLMPLLLFLYPNERPDVLTAISLAVVFVNAASGTLATHACGASTCDPDSCSRPRGSPARSSAPRSRAGWIGACSIPCSAWS
jgi:hypothetical protein